MGLTITAKDIAQFNGRTGAWIIYGNDTTVEAYYISQDPIDLLIRLANMGYGTPAFWPHGTELKEALAWWGEERKKYGSNLATPSTRRSGELS